jgi:lipoprotein Spr
LGLLAGILPGCSAPQKVAQADPMSVDATKHPLFLSHAIMPSSRTSSGKVHLKPAEDPFSRSYRAAEINPSAANALQLKYSMLLQVPPQKIANIGLYGFIDAWWGTPYRFGGTDHTGIDCSAFVQRLYGSVFGMNLVRTAIEQFGTSHIIWDFDNLKEGDLVFFHTTGSRISHVGVYLANNFFVHSSSSRGVGVSSLTESYWTHAFAGAGRVL